MKRNKERILLLATTVILVVMAWQYNHNIKSTLEKVEEGYSEKTVLNLNEDFNEKALIEILSKADYFGDVSYESFLVKSLKQKLQNNTLPNLGALNKRTFMVNAEEMNQNAGEWGKTRYLISSTELGQNSDFFANIDTIKLSSQKKVSEKESGLTISGKVTKYRELSLIEKIKEKLHLLKKVPAINVVVCLKEELPQTVKDSIVDAYLGQYKNTDFSPLFSDSLFKAETLDLDKIVKLETFYAITDKDGKYSFSNLDRGKNYSVIPVKKGKEYGVLKGVSQISKSNNKLNFIEKEHLLPLFDAKSFALIKKDRALTVRTPMAFRHNFIRSFFLFILGFWLFHIALTLNKNRFEEYMLPTLMLLSGIGLVVLYAVQDPLRDMDFGTSAAMRMFYVVMLMSSVLFLRKKWLQRIIGFRLSYFLHNKNLLPTFLTKNLHKAPRGYIWLFFSISLILLLAILGDGPEGSNVKVNLFGIQVSELSKFLMIVFFSYFFTANFSSFRTITNNYYLIKKYNLPMFLGFIILLVLYVGVVGDQGPAMVLCITFLFFYSYAKDEFFVMILSGIGFGVLLMVMSKLLGNSNLMSVICGGFIIAALIYSLKVKKHESVFFIILLISSFIILADFDVSFSQRLADRNSMFLNKWDNSLHGGDQVAQGVWALNSGGFSGQGLGRGFSNVMPAYHTDMMFESIGEELGMISLFAILILFGLLFYRTMLVARRTGNTFLFYLINGFAIVTLVQLGIIVSGSLGLIPLTGISVPFLSKGDSGLMLNLAVFLFVIVLSQIKGSNIELKHIQKNFDTLNAYVILTFGGIILLFMTTLGVYYANANNTMIRPVKVLSKQGEWMYSENPRLSIIKDKLKAGNIYDRNGVLLATSEKETFLSAQSKAQRNLANMEAFEKQKRSIRKRYYPFSEDLIYWLGDANTGLVANENIGYVAEYRLQSKLRGIDAPIINNTTVTSNQYREASYLPTETKVSVLKQYDNSYYRKFLKAGIDSKLIERENAKKDKDIYLTLDVKLNQLLNEIIRSDEYKDYKAAVVAIKTNSGDVLASAINPSPNISDIQKLVQIKPKYYNMLLSVMFGYNHFVADRDFGLFYRSVPGSTIKAVDALAFMSRAGVGGADTTYTFIAEERIRKDDPIGKVDMRRAIVESSNNYFISLMNNEELHPELFRLYNSVGINIANKAGYYVEKPSDYIDADAEAQWFDYISKNKGVNFFNPKLKGTKDKYKGSDYSWIAWGQGPVESTPLQMARLFGAVANHGPLFANKFIYRDNQGITSDVEETNLETKPGITGKLESFLQAQSTSARMSERYKVTIYGKTGSPERKEKAYNATNKKSTVVGRTDGWFVFYVKHSKYEGSPIVIAIRIQGKGNSANAAAIAREIIEKMKANQIIING